MADNYIPKFEDTEEIVPKFEETEDVNQTIAPVEQPSNPGIFSKISSSIADSLKEGKLAPTDMAASTLKKLYPKLEAKDFNPMPYLTGGQQGISAGTSDEIAGGLGASADMVAGNSPEMPGESKLERYKRLYKEYRNMERNRLAEVQKENPEAYMAGDIGASFLLPYGKVAQGMQKIAPSSKVIQGLGTAQVTGFAEGLGRTEAEEMPQILSDAADTAALSSIIPIGLTATKAVTNTAKAMTPTKIKEEFARAYDLGKKGLNIREQPVINNLVDELKTTAEQKVSKPIQEINEGFVQNKTKADAKIAELESQAKETVENQTLQQNITNEALRTEVGNKIAQKAEDIQKNVGNLRNTLSKGYSTVDSLAEKDKIKINTRDFIKQFVSDLGTDGDLDDAAITSLYKKLDRYNGDMSIADFNSLKREINKLTSFNPTTPRTRGLAKRAYGQLNESYANQLEQMGRQDLAVMTKELNKSWSAMSGFDDFIEANVDKNLGGQIYPEGETVKSITKLAKEGPETKGVNQKFMDYLTKLFPNENPEDLKKLSKSYENTKKFTPNVQSKDELLANNQQYQELVQPTTPNFVEQKMNQFSGTPEAVNKKILDLTPKMDSKLSSSLGSQQEIDDLFEILRKTKGDDYVNKAREELSDKLLTYNTLKSANPGQTFDVTTKAQQVRSIYDLVTQGGLTAMSNRMGRSSNSLAAPAKLFTPRNMGVVAGTTAAMVDKNKVRQDVLNQYVQQATPEQLNQNAQALVDTYGKDASKLASELESMSRTDRQGKIAKAFAISQDPNNKKMLENFNNNEFGNEETDVENDEVDGGEF